MNIIAEVLRQRLREQGRRITSSYVPDDWQPDHDLLERARWLADNNSVRNDALPPILRVIRRKNKGQ